MENYKIISKIGEGTYGIVYKAEQISTSRIVAIKQFRETTNDLQIKKIAMREIQLLSKLRHDNIVSLLEVFKYQNKINLVFEYIPFTALELIELNPQGLDPLMVKKLMYQLLRAVEHIHSNEALHRDIKPENLLISSNYALKLCDFGFARYEQKLNPKYTDYVSTRWYRAPELLVGETNYGKAVDIWSIGCMLCELINTKPIFPGDSDVEMIELITNSLKEDLTDKQIQAFNENEFLKGSVLPKRKESLKPFIVLKLNEEGHDFLSKCFQIDPSKRWTASQLLSHRYFDEISEAFPKELRYILESDKKENKFTPNNSKEKVDIVFSPKKQKSKIFSELKAKKVNIFLNKSYVTRKSPHRTIMNNLMNLNKKKIIKNLDLGDQKNFKNMQRNIFNNKFRDQPFTKRKNQVSFFLKKTLSKLFMDEHNLISKSDLNPKLSYEIKVKLMESNNQSTNLNNSRISPDEKDLSLTRSNKYIIHNFFSGQFKNSFQDSNSNNKLTKKDSLITNYPSLSYSRYNLNCGIESIDNDNQSSFIKSSFQNGESINSLRLKKNLVDSPPTLPKIRLAKNNIKFINLNQNPYDLKKAEKFNRLYPLDNLHLTILDNGVRINKNDLKRQFFVKKKRILIGVNKDIIEQRNKGNNEIRNNKSYSYFNDFNEKLDY